MKATAHIPPELLPKNEDLLLSAAFIEDAQARADVLLLQAFLETLREIPLRAKEPLMGDIRLQWWREAIEEIEAGQKVRYHPINAALEDLKARRHLDLTPLSQMIDAQSGLLDRPLSLDAVMTAVEGGEGIVARMGALIIEPNVEASGLVQAARHYGLSLFLGEGGLPRDDLTSQRLNETRAEARQGMRGLPTRLMPLAAHVTMARDYGAGKTVGPLRRRLKVLWGFLSGRL